jgi:hypothetical protein
MAALNVATSVLVVLPAVPGTVPDAQLLVSLQLPSLTEPPVHVPGAANAVPPIAKAMAGRRHKKCRTERKARVALVEESDVFLFMETLRGLVSNAIIATK